MEKDRLRDRDTETPRERQRGRDTEIDAERQRETSRYTETHKRCTHTETRDLTHMETRGAQ